MESGKGIERAMIIRPEPQGSLDWLQARAGVITASEFDNLLTGEFKIRDGEMPKTYLARKLAEMWLGSPLAGFQSVDMDIGTVLETEGIPFFEIITNQTVQRVGLITTDDGRVGCSPDGLLGDDSGIELKCARPETHTKYLLSGTVPKEYRPQVHGAMFVTGRPRWVFMSYCRRMPPLIITVERNEEIMGVIEEALGFFLADLDAAWNRMVEINKGLPRHLTSNAGETKPEFTPNTEDQLV